MQELSRHVPPAVDLQLARDRAPGIAAKARPQRGCGSLNGRVTESVENLGQGGIERCCWTRLPRAFRYWLADDFSTLHLDRWKPSVNEQEFVGISFVNREPRSLGAQIRSALNTSKRS